jgi:excinuclease ABC subunit C
MRETELAEIPDVGKIRARILLDHFGNIDSVRKATIDELQNAQGIGRTTAEKIYNHYRKEETTDEI